MKKMSIVSSPGRISVMGEHSWLVKEAIMLGIDEYRTYVKIIKMSGAVSVQSINFSEITEICDRDIDQANFGWIDYVKGCILFFENNFDIKVEDIKICINSVLPIEAGLSSSAALVSSVIAGLCDYFEITFTKAELAHFSYITEKKILHRSVGQMDMYGCVFGGATYVDCTECPVERIEQYSVPENVRIIVGNTTMPKKTKQVVDQIKRRIDAGDVLVQKHVFLQKEYIRQLRDEISQSSWDLNKIGGLINMSQASLKDNLQVSSDYLDSLCLAALSSGAYGAKLTGAGVGGCMFAVCDNLVEDSVVKSLESQGAKVYRFSYSQKGVMIEDNEKNFINGLQYTYEI